MKNVPVFHRVCQCGLMVSLFLVLAGCSSLLPTAKQEAQLPWRSYEEAQNMFARIVPGQTRLVDLRTLGIESEKTPNIAVLSHADLLRRLVASSAVDIRQFDPALQVCLTAQATCYAYEIEQTYLERNRVGNFWLDFLNFDRRIQVTGWQFDVIVVIQNDMVIYKLWSGKPKINQFEHEHSPLGPLQGFGPALLLR